MNLGDTPAATNNRAIANATQIGVVSQVGGTKLVRSKDDRTDRRTKGNGLEDSFQQADESGMSDTERMRQFARRQTRDGATPSGPTPWNGPQGQNPGQIGGDSGGADNRSWFQKLKDGVAGLSSGNPWMDMNTMGMVGMMGLTGGFEGIFMGTAMAAATGTVARQNQAMMARMLSGYGGPNGNLPPGVDPSTGGWSPFGASPMPGPVPTQWSPTNGQAQPPVHNLVPDWGASRLYPQYAQLRNYAAQRGSLDGTFVTPYTQAFEDAGNLQNLQMIIQRSVQDFQGSAGSLSQSDQQALGGLLKQINAKARNYQNKGNSYDWYDQAVDTTTGIRNLAQSGKISASLANRSAVIDEMLQMYGRSAANLCLKTGHTIPANMDPTYVQESPFNRSGQTGGNPMMTV